MAGMEVVGHDRYGVYPLKGKPLNVRDVPWQEIVDNQQMTELIKILGLQNSRTYDTDEDMDSLRYGRLMIMADQVRRRTHVHTKCTRI